jgi:predicted ester cyclase
MKNLVSSDIPKNNYMNNTEVITTWFEEVWNQKKEDTISKLAAPKLIAHGLVDEQGNEMVGVENFFPFFRTFINSFPDISVKVLHVVEEGNKVAALTEFTLPHTGKAFKINDNKSIEPSGKSHTLTGVAFSIIENGQIKETWNCYDFLGFYSQLGAI